MGSQLARIVFVGQDERSVESWDVQSCTELHKLSM